MVLVVLSVLWSGASILSLLSITISGLQLVTSYNCTFHYLFSVRVIFIGLESYTRDVSQQIHCVNTGLLADPPHSPTLCGTTTYSSLVSNIMSRHY